MGFGIRGKLLSFSGAVVALVVALELVAQGAASRSGREFEDRIAEYHVVHRLRVALAAQRALADRYLKEADPALKSSVEKGYEDLSAMADALEPLAAISLEAEFQVRAARRGIEAFLPPARTAIAMRAEGKEGYYPFFTRAEKIGAYADGYLTALLSAAMDSGESRGRAALARASTLRSLSLFGIFAVGFASLVFAVLFSSSITAPIRRLARASERMAAGELAIEPVVSPGGDEVTILARGFNAMSQNIRSLVEGLKEKAELERQLHDEELSLANMGRALREAQFMNLQDQMRPHFIYNCLNTIARNALNEGAPVAEALARGLARLLRYATAQEGAFVPLEHELGIVAEYLAFQKVRFGERLAWTMEADEGTRSFLVPRFTLQPMVENAVRHGIEPKVEGGRVRLSVRAIGGRIRIMIADTGVGMGPALLRTLRSALDGVSDGAAPITPGEGQAGIGLANLKGRLVFRYGESVTIGIASREGRGTVLRVSIPRSEARLV
jgi:signal transduction histidine kinase